MFRDPPTMTAYAMRAPVGDHSSETGASSDAIDVRFAPFASMTSIVAASPPITWLVKAIRPAGDHVGNSSSTPGVSVRFTGDRPLYGFTVQMSRLPERPLANARVVPSGDQAGARSSPVPLGMRCRNPVPSGSIWRSDLSSPGGRAAKTMVPLRPGKLAGASPAEPLTA